MSPAPELVGASERPLVLAGSPATTSVALAAASVTPPGLVSLHFDDIVAQRDAQTDYEVSIAVPGAAPRYVGTVSFLGVESAAQAFDITLHVDALRAQGRWDDRRVTVAFRPVWTVLPPGASGAVVSAGARSAPVRIGRVSVFYA